MVCPFYFLMYFLTFTWILFLGLIKCSLLICKRVCLIYIKCKHFRFSEIILYHAVKHYDGQLIMFCFINIITDNIFKRVMSFHLMWCEINPNWNVCVCCRININIYYLKKIHICHTYLVSQNLSFKLMCCSNVWDPIWMYLIS